MALAALNSAASNLVAWAGNLSALAPAKLAVIPVIAGLAIGTAAGASFMTTSSEPAAKAPQPVAATVAAPIVIPEAAAPAPATRPCAAQTWPYIDAKCLAGTPQEKRVRLVSVPRPGEATDVKTNTLVTRDTVLRQPQNLDAIPPAAAAPARREKRKEARRKRDRRWAKQSYSVPYESRGRYSGPVIVVRPMRPDTFR